MLRQKEMRKIERDRGREERGKKKIKIKIKILLFAKKKKNINCGRVFYPKKVQCVFKLRTLFYLLQIEGREAF